MPAKLRWNAPYFSPLRLRWSRKWTCRAYRRPDPTVISKLDAPLILDLAGAEFAPPLSRICSTMRRGSLDT